MQPDLLKQVLYMHSFKIHFSPSFVGYINGPTAHAFNTAENMSLLSLRTLSQACLTSMSAWVAFKWPKLN